jgi:hypothetical protein
MFFCRDFDARAQMRPVLGIVDRAREELALDGRVEKSRVECVIGGENLFAAERIIRRREAAAGH